MNTLAELQKECANLGINVETNGRASKEPYIAALRDYHWQKEHSDETLPAQIMPMLLGSWDDLDETYAEEIEQDCHAWIVQPKLDGVRALLHIETGRVCVTSRTVSEKSFRLSELQANVPHVQTGWDQLAGTILDGELVCPVAEIETGSSRTANPLQAAVASNWKDAERHEMTRFEDDGRVQLNPNFVGRKAKITGQEESAKSHRIRHARIARWV